MKGICIGGIGRFPRHPAADIHGFVRIVCRARDWNAVSHIFDRYGIRGIAGGIFEISKSQVEQQVSAQHYGEILVCPLTGQYVSAANYEPLKSPEFYQDQEKQQATPKRAPGVTPMKVREFE